MIKCKIGSQGHRHLCIGSWDSSRHPKRKPGNIWKDAQQTLCYPVPCLQILSLTIQFSAEIGSMLFDSCTTAGLNRGENLFPDFSSGMYANDEENIETASTTQTSAINMELSFRDDHVQHDEDPLRFPIMQKYGIPVNCTATTNALIQEPCKLHGGKHIDFSHGNNWCALLLQVPTSSSKYQFNQLVAEHSNFLDAMLSFIPNGHDNDQCTAAEWLLNSLLEKYVDEFVSVAIKKGIATLENKVMDAPIVNAMLKDCNINSTTV